MALLDFTRRSRVLGLPIGPRQTRWSKVLAVGAGAVAGTVAGTASLLAARTTRTPQAGDDAAPAGEAPADEDRAGAPLVHVEGNGRPRDERGRFLSTSNGDGGGERRERAAGRDRQAG